MTGAADAAERRPPDLRLVPAAATVWAVMLLGLGLGPVVGGSIAVGAGMLTVVVGVAQRSPVLLAVVGSAAAAGVVITVQTAVVAAHPLHDIAPRGAAATVRVIVSDDPRPLRTATPTGGPAAELVLVSAELVEADVGAGRWTGGGRVLLLAPADGWSGLLPGQVVTAAGLLAPPERADLTVAVLRVRGAPDAVTAPPWWQTAAQELRRGLRDAATTSLGPAEAGLLPGLAIGDTSGLSTDVGDDFRAAGLTHLVAVSGDTACQTGALGYLTTVNIPRAAVPSVARGQPKMLSGNNRSEFRKWRPPEWCAAGPGNGRGVDE